MRDPQAALEAAFRLDSEGEDRTEAAGEAWGRALRGGEVLLLTGELGAGKTALVRGLGRGLGVVHGVKSPTFAILLSYPGRLRLHHVDLYRVNDGADVEELGLEDLVEAGSVLVVEWGERMGASAPPGAIRIRLDDLGGDRRRLEVAGPGEPVARLARAVGAVPGPGPGGEPR